MGKPEKKSDVQELRIVKEKNHTVKEKETSGDKRFDEAIDRMLFGKKSTVSAK